MIRGQVARFLGLASRTERVLHDAILLVAARHEADHDIGASATVMADWRTGHLAALAPIEARYGARATERPDRIRGLLLTGQRTGGPGLLDDLRDLVLLVEESRTTWSVLREGGRELRDASLVALATAAGEHDDRTLDWLRTVIEALAPDALATDPSPRNREADAVPTGLDRLARVPDPVWVPLAGGAVLAVVGAASVVLATPFLVASLGPSAAVVAGEPEHPSARPWNIVVGHAAGVLAGFVSLLVFGAVLAPTLLADKTLDPGRAAASALAVGLTLLLGLLLRAVHPAAAATTLLVTLGAVRTLEDVVHLGVGVVLVALAGELVRRLGLRRRALRADAQRAVAAGAAGRVEVDDGSAALLGRR